MVRAGCVLSSVLLACRLALSLKVCLTQCEAVVCYCKRRHAVHRVMWIIASQYPILTPLMITISPAYANGIVLMDSCPGSFRQVAVFQRCNTVCCYYFRARGGQMFLGMLGCLSQ